MVEHTNALFSALVQSNVRGGRNCPATVGAAALLAAPLMTSASRLWPMTPSTFAEILEDRLKHVEAAVALIEKGEGDRAALDRLRGHLIDP